MLLSVPKGTTLEELLTLKNVKCAIIGIDSPEDPDAIVAAMPHIELWYVNSEGKRATKRGKNALSEEEIEEIRTPKYFRKKK